MKRFKQPDSPILVGVIGAGSMGKRLFRQLSMTPQMQCVALVDINIDRAVRCASACKRDYRIVDSLKSMRSAIEKNVLAICEDGKLAAECDEISVIIEASNSIGPAGKISEKAICQGKHVVIQIHFCTIGTLRPLLKAFWVTRIPIGACLRLYSAALIVWMIFSTKSNGLP